MTEDALRARIVRAVTQQPQPTVTVLSSLLAVEDELGWIPPEAIEEVAARQAVTSNDVWAVASFYPNFRFTPPGEHVFEVCWGPTCHLMGAQRLLDRVHDALGLDGEGDTADGSVTLRYNTCLGACSQAPVVSADHHLHGRTNPDACETLIAGLRAAAGAPLSHPSPVKGEGVNGGPPSQPSPIEEEGVAERFEALQQQAQAHAAGLDSRTRVRVGVALCGHAAGALPVLDALRREASSRGLDASVHEVGCIGLCYAEPLVDVQSPGGPRVFYRNVTPEQVPGILDAAASGRWSDGGDVLGTLGEGAVDGLARIDDWEQWKLQVRIATRLCGIVDPGDILEYIAAGGYGGLAKALAEMSQEELIEEVKASGLRGRGGAAFPTGVKWGFLQGSNRPNKYVLVNCEEGDPGAFNDKGLIESDPHTVVEGTIIAGRATGANYGYIFIRHGHDGPIDRAKEAIRQAYEHGLLGEDILGSGFSFDMEVALTGDSYVAGEETALMEAIEGKRSMPRYRPPFPAQVGVWGNPSNINNVKTLAYVPELVRLGGEWFSGIGYERSKGTALLCLTGNVNYPGMYEVPFGLTLGQVVNDIAGGVATGGPVKLLQTGGPLGGVLGPDSLEITLDYELMAQAGAILGSGGIIVGSDDVDAVDLAWNLVAFCQYESCGKCFPCRLGMTHLLDTLERIASNAGRAEDLDLMRTIGKTMGMGSLCGHGQLGFNPISSSLRHFEADFRMHLEGGRRTTGSRTARFHRPTRTSPEAVSGWYVEQGQPA